MAKWGEVIQVTELRRISAAGEVESFYRYRVTTKGGITFTETVPEADTAPERLEPILRAKAERLDAAKAL